MRLPVDLVVTEKFAADSPPQTVDVGAVPNGLMGLDIGPGSIKRFSTLLSNAGTIFWNGPMGVFEFPAYAAGTRGVAEAIVAATGKGAFSVVGRGVTAADHTKRPFAGGGDDRLGDASGAGRISRELEYSHRPVPEDCPGVGQQPSEPFERSPPDIQAHQAI
ncbi:phosphoglycerate kinase, partial [Streptococcus pneumoniae]